jgi:hypothetical protein
VCVCVRVRVRGPARACASLLFVDTRVCLVDVCMMQRARPTGANLGALLT